MKLNSSILTAMVLGTVLMAGSAINVTAAHADQVACPPGAQCPPPGTSGDQGKYHKPDMGKPGNPPPGGNSQSGQNDNGGNPNNMDWKHRHRSGSGVDVGVSGNGNEDWRRRHHRGDNGVDVGVGIYLGDGYDNGYYGHRRYYHGFVSCGEASDIVRASGFRHVRTESCASERYRFSGTRHGTAFAIAVSRGGRIVGVRPIY